MHGWWGKSPLMLLVFFVIPVIGNLLVEMKFWHELPDPIYLQNCQTNSHLDPYPMPILHPCKVQHTEIHSPTNFTSGKCFYELSEVLEISWHRNTTSGHEFYGITSSPHFSSSVEIIANGIVWFKVWQ